MVDPDSSRWRLPGPDGLLVNPNQAPSPRFVRRPPSFVDLEKTERAAEVRLRHAELSYEKIFWRLSAISLTQSDEVVSSQMNMQFSDKELRYIMARNRERCAHTPCHAFCWAFDLLSRLDFPSWKSHLVWARRKLGTT